VALLLVDVMSRQHHLTCEILPGFCRPASTGIIGLSCIGIGLSMICTCIRIGLSIGIAMNTICSVGFIWFAHCNLAICMYWNTVGEPLVAVFQHFFYCIAKTIAF